MKRAVIVCAALLFALVAPAEAQQTPALTQETRPATASDDNIEAIRQISPFAPAVHKEQIQEALSVGEHGRLHPYFRAVVTEERLRDRRPIDSEAVRAAPGLTLQEGGLILHSATIYTRNPGAVERAGVEVNSIYSSFVTARLTADEAARLADDEHVRFIAPADVAYPTNDMSVPLTGAHLLHKGFVRNTPYRGEGTIVCVFDTGIDFEHADFIDEDGETRILSIWDQTLEDPQSSEQRPSGFSYGVEYTREHINNDLNTLATGFVRQRDTHGHGTHVAGTAVGNGRAHNGIYGGMAPMADLVIVKGGDESFPTTNIIDGLTYCGGVAQAEGKPVVVNMSLGGQLGAHDGSRAHELAIDEFTSAPGRIVVTSAGNSGSEAIHISREIPAGQTETVEFFVPSYTPVAGSDNDHFRFDAWFDNERDVTVAVTSPSIQDNTVTATYEVGESGTHEDNTAGTIYVAHDDDDALGGATLRTNLQIYDGDEQRPPAPGTWQLSFSNNEAEPVSFHGWMYDRGGGPGITFLIEGDSLYTISSPGTSREAITVGSYNTRTLWPSADGSSYRFLPLQERGDLSNFSSIGPTRDGRIKPDLVAPGRTIISSRSESAESSEATTAPGEQHRATQGTSMSAPHVSGAAALLLSQFPSYSANDIRDLLLTSAQQDDFTRASLPGIPDNRVAFGAGKLDVFRAFLQAFGGSVATRDRYVYAGDTHFRVPLQDRRFAVRITPDADGLLTGLDVDIASLDRSGGNEGVEGTGNVQFALYDDAGGYPGSPITETLSRPLSEITPTSTSHFSFVGAERSNLAVDADSDYHLVLHLDDASDTFDIFSDDGSNGTGRSSVYSSSSGWQRTGDFFSDAVEFRIGAIITRTDEAALLPVVLDRFEAVIEEGEGQLSWRTLSEQNNDITQVQHAPPQGTFRTVMDISGGGTTDEPRDYSVTLSDLDRVGEHRFRLRYVSEGGAWAYSDEVAFLVEVDGRYELSQPYPNPFTDHVQVHLSVAEEQNVQVFVYDVLGRRLATAWDASIVANREEIISFSDPSLSSGLYLIRVVGEHFADTRPVTLVR